MENGRYLSVIRSIARRYTIQSMTDAKAGESLAGGMMGALMRSLDWSSTPVGPVDGWPQSLKTAVRIALHSRYPMFVWWGPQRINFYNDGYIPVLGKRHPMALGRPAADVWSDIWETVGPQADLVYEQGRATWNEQLLLVMERNGYPEETYFTFSYSPIVAEDGRVEGLFCACSEETERVLNERRLRTLRVLAERAAQARSADDACDLSAQALATNPHDVPFALLYLLDESGERAHLSCEVGVERGSEASPETIEIGAPTAWPLDEVLATGSSVLAERLFDRFPPLPGGPWPEAPETALVLPVAHPGHERPAGFLVAGVSPRRAFDDGYRGFFDLVAGHIATAIANARAHEAERRRAEALAEIDRAKTDFFSNVSHEFRTPLALMLGPLEDALSGAHGELSAAQREDLLVAHRNGLRMLKLVNTLLDFSRIEAGRIDSTFEPVDLAAATAEIASAFRSAAERAGLRFVVDCAPLPEPIYVDREMWEKIVLNLVSNALKFTFEGEIAVSLEWTGEAARLTVRDTGTGIAPSELPQIFERFYRNRGARSRTHEGTGIGLALVQELVHLHGGEIVA